MTRDSYIENVRQTQIPFRRFLLALCCGDTFLADDIAQETYLKAWINWENIKNEKAVNVWLRSTAYHIFINIKRRAALFDQSETALEKCIASSDYHPEDKYKYEELYMALNGLSTNERTTIILYYLEEYSVRDIAQVQGLTEVNVRKIMSRARERIRTLLKETNL